MKSIEEEIKYRTELIKLIAFYLLTLLGGEIGLLLKLDNTIKLIMFIIGLPTIILLGVLLWQQHKKVLDLIEKIKED